jgi:hypothetical protein
LRTSRPERSGSQLERLLAAAALLGAVALAVEELGDLGAEFGIIIDEQQVEIRFREG